MYYLQSRYYDANVGRFVIGDDVEVALKLMYRTQTSIETNVFLYCGNSPLVFIDLYGYKKVKMSVSNTIVFGIIGMVVNLVRYGTNIFRIFKSTSVTDTQKILYSIAYLLPVEMMTEFVKYHVKNLASMIVTYSRSIVFELAMLGLNAGKLSVAGLAITAICTAASLYLPKFFDSISMILYGLKNRCYYWDVKWYGIKYYAK